MDNLKCGASQFPSASLHTYRSSIQRTQTKFLLWVGWFGLKANWKKTPQESHGVEWYGVTSMAGCFGSTAATSDTSASGTAGNSSSSWKRMGQMLCQGFCTHLAGHRVLKGSVPGFRSKQVMGGHAIIFKFVLCPLTSSH